MASWAGAGEVGVALRSAALPPSRIFWICALRCGATGSGGGGVVAEAEGRERRVRCRVLRAWRSVGSVDAVVVVVVVESVVEVERALDWGSRCRGSRVKGSFSVAMRWFVLFLFLFLFLFW